MSVSAATLEQAKELFSGLGHVQVRPLFGGKGLYFGGQIFGFLDDDLIYLKTDDLTEARFREAGSEPFVYVYRSGRELPMSYWRLPDSAWDDPEEALDWARLALAAADRHAAKKPVKKKKRGSA